MTDVFKDIREFVDKYGWKKQYDAGTITYKEAFIKIRQNLNNEEDLELKIALANKDAEEINDALTDGLVTRLAMQYIVGIDGEKSWIEVHRANMSKVSGMKKGRENPDNMPDVIKPDGWIGPDHSDNHGSLTEVYAERPIKELMSVHEAKNVATLLQVLNQYDDVVPKGEMIELIGVCFEADENTVIGNIDAIYMSAELMWYISEERNMRVMNETLGFIPQAWQNVMNDEGDVNSNYGWCVHNKENYNQFEEVVAKLRQDPKSRQAVAIYTNPRMHQQYKENGKNDFICTNAVQYYIRNGKLEVVVQMRSNDANFGYKYDYWWQLSVQIQLANELGIETGKIIWQAANFHVYPEYRHLIKEAIALRK